MKDDLDQASSLLANYCQPLEGVEADYNGLIGRVGDARVVLLGESTYGTREFYQERARITRLLIEKKGFNAVIFEDDWQLVHRLNRYIRGAGRDSNAGDALASLDYFSSWLVNNQETIALLEELAHLNRMRRSENQQVALYGLDSYGFYRAVDNIIAHLAEFDLNAGNLARERFSAVCTFGADIPKQQGSLKSLIGRDYSEAIVDSLLQDRRRDIEVNLDGFAFADSKFLTEQMPESPGGAQLFYRALLDSPIVANRYRDQAMSLRLDGILNHLDSYLDKPGKAVVWAHNRSIADSRAHTNVGETSLGQMVRQNYGQQSFLVGMTTYQGSLTATSGWGKPASARELAPARSGSLEDLFHRLNCQNFLIIPTLGADSYDQLNRRFDHRAVGSVYLPENREANHYLLGNPALSYDAVIHIDSSRALLLPQGDR